MSAAYRLTPRARRGFEHIVRYGEEQFGGAVAELVVTELEKAFERLAANPAMGHTREMLTRDERVRFWSVGPTLIGYRSKPKWIEILLVERGELDWQRMLAEYLK